MVYQIIGEKKGEEGGYKENQNRWEKMKKKRKKSEVKIKRENIIYI